MFNMTKRRRGAISIFLVIVLVPMLMVSSIFVDMSRIQLANSAAASAGDLALNTALTDYDAVLKDMYGLFATSQDIDELLENLEDYYRKSIEAAGVSELDADNYVDQIMGMLKSSTGTDDLLNMNLTEFEVTKPTGGSLSNPAILKTQIVEFMKYRAPLNLGSGFLEALQSMKNLDKQTDLVNDKNEFYESQKSLLENLEKAWKKIQTYQYSSASEGFPTGTYIENQVTKLNDHAKTLNDTIIPETVTYLYYKDYFYTNDCALGYVEGDDDESIYDDTWKIQWGENNITTCSRAYDEDDTATTQDVIDCLNTALAAIKNAKKYTSDTYPLYQTFLTTQGSDAGKIYAVAQFNKVGKEEYGKAIKQLLQSLINLESAIDRCSVDEMQSVKITYDAENYTAVEAEDGTLVLYQFAKNQIISHLEPYKNGNANNYFSIFNNITEKLDLYVEDLSDTLNSKAITVNNSFKALRNDTVAFDKYLEKKIKNLTDAISILNGVKSTLSNSGSDYNTKLQNWENAAEKLADDSMGKADKKEIEELKTLLTESKVNSLITKLTSAKSTLESIRTQIAAYKFEGTSWKDIAENSGYTKVKSMFTSSQKSAIESIVPTSNNAYDTVTAQIQATIAKGNVATTWTNEANPDLTKEQRELYTWLYNNYYDPSMSYSDTDSTANKTTSGDDELKSSQDALKGTADTYKDKETAGTTTKVNTNIADYSDYLPSAEWDSLYEQVKDGKVETDSDALLSSSSAEVTSLLGSLMSALDGMGTTLRDDMYITNYIMTMFSYDTYETELTKKNGGDLSGFSSWYEKQDDGTYKVKDEYKKYAAEALSLTNNSINPNMNYLYGSEVEYIVYGGSDMAANKTEAYATIFLIRFAFNTVYAFTDAEINNTTMAAATAIFGTPPLTPLIPIAKVAMMIGLAIAESSYDLYILKTGDAVPLIKNSDTWVMKPSGAAKAATAVVLKEVTNYAIDAGYKVLSDALEKTDEELEKMINAGTGELANLANSVVASTLDQFKNYANEAIQYVVSLCNNANLEEMMNSTLRAEDGTYNGFQVTDAKVNYVMAELDAWLAEQGAGTDDTIYEVKSIAVDYLKADNGKAIREIFEQIAASTNTTDGSVLNKKLDDIQESISQKITDVSNTANTKLNDLREEVMSKIEEAAKNGAESLRAELKNQIGKTFGTSAGATKGTSNVVSSLLSWSYSDYLTLFLLISTLTDLDSVLVRTADVIELNMQHMNGEYASITTTETKTVSRFWGLWKTTEEVTTTQANQAAFKLKNSYTYLSISAKIEVKPLLMALPFMESTTESQLTGTNWYEIEYEGVLGY